MKVINKTAMKFPRHHAIGGVTFTLFSGGLGLDSEGWENQHGRGGSFMVKLFLFSVEIWYKKDY